jgi:hypothetical protein
MLALGQAMRQALVVAVAAPAPIAERALQQARPQALQSKPLRRRDAQQAGRTPAEPSRGAAPQRLHHSLQGSEQALRPWPLSVERQWIRRKTSGADNDNGSVRGAAMTCTP